MDKRDKVVGQGGRTRRLDRVGRLRMAFVAALEDDDDAEKRISHSRIRLAQINRSRAHHPSSDHHSYLAQRLQIRAYSFWPSAK